MWILINISQQFVPKGQINNSPALVQITAWDLPGDKPLSEPMMVSSLMHICIPRPQWVKRIGWMVLNKWNCCDYYKWNGFKMMQMELLLLIILSFKWARHAIMTFVWAIFYKSDGKFITVWGCDAYWYGMCICSMIGEEVKMVGWLYVFMLILKQKILARSCFMLNFHFIPNLLSSNMEYV